MIHNIADLEAWLSRIPMFSNKGISAMKGYSLDSLKAFLAEIGNPQHHFFSIHIAGTNGKGSIA
jgi:dihydrofolate synthase/folylpolyglutamate synthase